MARATEEHGDHPLFELERGEITETSSSARLERQLGGGFELDRLRDALLRATSSRTRR